MKIDKLKPGITVYDVHKYRMGNTTLLSVGVWIVGIVAVDIEKRKVVASWNGNPPWTYSERNWSKWRMDKPKLVRMPLGNYRLARRDEIKGGE